MMPGERKSTVLSASLSLMILVACGCGSNAWKTAERTNTIAGYEQFLEHHPNAEQAPLARQRVENLRWDAAQDSNSVSTYEDFMQRYPNSKLAATAMERIASLRWKVAQDDNTVAGYEQFLAKCPEGQHGSAARHALLSLRWAEVRARNTQEAYRSFLSQCGDSSLADSANQCIRELEKQHLRELEAEGVWRSAEHANTTAGYRTFAQRYPESRHLRTFVGRVSDVSFPLGRDLLATGLDIELAEFPGLVFRCDREGAMEYGFVGEVAGSRSGEYGLATATCMGKRVQLQCVETKGESSDYRVIGVGSNKRKTSN